MPPDRPSPRGCPADTPGRRRHSHTKQRYGIAALVEKFQLYRLAAIMSPARAELATADGHGFGRRLINLRRGRLCCHMESASYLRVKQTTPGGDCGEAPLEPDPAPEQEASAAGLRYMWMDITYLCRAMQSLTRLRYTEAGPYQAIACSIG